jgi:putative ABC transport system ATP-binding protein
MTDCLLSLVDVSRSVRRGSRLEPLLTDVSLSLDPGELVAVIGMRSQGKTTLLQLAAGLERPDSGSVYFAGRDLATLSDGEHAELLRNEIGLVEQGGLRPDLRMAHYVAAPLLVSRRRSRTRKVSIQAAAALDRVGMGSRAEQRWGELSSWDRVLVEIAQGIVSGPRLLLVDDVTDGLGMREVAHVTHLLRSLALQDGMGILMTASDSEAASGAQRVLRVSHGGLRQIAAQRYENHNIHKIPGSSSQRRRQAP